MQNESIQNLHSDNPNSISFEKKIWGMPKLILISKENILAKPSSSEESTFKRQFS